jgi:hypothetical protein
MIGLCVVDSAQAEHGLHPVVSVMGIMMRVGCLTMIVGMDDDAGKGSDRRRGAHAESWPDGKDQRRRPQQEAVSSTCYSQSADHFSILFSGSKPRSNWPV